MFWDTCERQNVVWTIYKKYFDMKVKNFQSLYQWKPHDQADLGQPNMDQVDLGQPSLDQVDLGPPSLED